MATFADARSDITGTEFEFDFGWGEDFTEYDGGVDDDSEIYTPPFGPLADSALEPPALLDSLSPSLEPLLAEYNDLGDLAAYSYWLEPLLQDFGFDQNEIRAAIQQGAAADEEQSADEEGLDWEDVYYVDVGNECDGCSECEWVDLRDEISNATTSADTPTDAQMTNLEAT